MLFGDVIVMQSGSGFHYWPKDFVGLSSFVSSESQFHFPPAIPMQEYYYSEHITTSAVRNTLKAGKLQLKRKTSSNVPSDVSDKLTVFSLADIGLPCGESDNRVSEMPSGYCLAQ